MHPAWLLEQRAEADVEKFAILSLSADHADASAMIFGRSPIDHLVSGLERSGVRRFLLTGDAPPTDAARIVDRIRARGLGASYHRSLSELDAVLPAEARLTLVAADSWMSVETLDRLQQFDKAVLVTGGPGWERLDRDHFWAGAATFGRRAVSAGADLPDSWDVASTLLRQLTQDGARRIDVGDDEGALPAPVRIESADTARRIEGAALGAGSRAHWLDRLLTRPIASGFLALTRRRPGLREPLSYLPIAAGLVAAGAGSFGSLVGAAAAASLALLADRALRRIDPERRDRSGADWRSISVFLLVAVAMLLLSRRADVALVSSASLILSAGLAATWAPRAPWHGIIPLLPVSALLLLLFALLAGTPAIGWTALICLGTMAGERVHRWRSEQSGLKRN